MIEPTRPHRLSDKQALAVIGSYFGLRLITVRVGLVFLPWLLTHSPWAVPLVRNTLLSIILAGAKVHRSPAMLAAIAAGSLFISTVAGLMLYWAGYRFGPELAVRGAKQGSVWAGIWNPKQVARAHRWLERRGFLAVAASRATGWLVTPIALVAGSSLMTFRKYIVAHTAGAIAWAAAGVWLGVRAGTVWPWLPERIESFSNWSWKAGLVLLALVIVLVAVSGKLPEQPARDAADPPGAEGEDPAGADDAPTAAD